MIAKISPRFIPFVMTILLLFSGVSSFLFFQAPIEHANATTILTQSTDTDFGSGTIMNLTINGTGIDSQLELEINNNYEWSKLTVTGKPSGRYGHIMSSIYDTDKILLFGGLDTQRTNDTWIYDYSDNTWTIIDPPVKPSARFLHAMAPIFGTDKVLLFGGNDGGVTNDTWIFDLSDKTWTKKRFSANIALRENHALASVWGTDKVVLFSGWMGWYVNDFCIYDLSDDTWVKQPSFALSARYNHAMSSIPGTDKIVLFGGKDQFGRKNDTWIYDYGLNTWTEMKPSGGITHRENQLITPVYGMDKITLFGGTGNSGTLEDTWVYDISENKWSEELLSINPTGLNDFSMASINGTSKAILFGGDSGSPVDDTWLFNNFNYKSEGTFIPGPIDTLNSSVFKVLSWNGEFPSDTECFFQLRTSINSEGLDTKEFVGPDGNNTKYYTYSPVIIWEGHNGDRWVQYKILLRTNDIARTPTITDVSIEYNNIPRTKLNTPENSSIVTINTPTFSWTFHDIDSSIQSAFQVLIDNSISFDSIDFDSNVQFSENTNWQFPVGTSYSTIPDGIWYWKSRVKDNDGDWGLYSDPFKLIIDTKIPRSYTTFPVTNGFYRTINTISGIASDPVGGTGLNKVEISIKRWDLQQYWDGSKWYPLETWLLTDGTNNWTFDAGDMGWVPNIQYSIISKATDNASNIELTGNGISFSIDDIKPSSTIEEPVKNSYLNDLKIITGISSDEDGSGLDSVEISIKKNVDGEYWNGSDWDQDESWLEVTGTKSWSFDSNNVEWISGSEYLISARGIDKAGNVEDDGPKISFIFDSEPPENISININTGDKYTHLKEVSLSLNAVDPVSGIAQISLSENTISWTPWEDYSNFPLEISITKQFNLHGSDGNKTIYFKVKDQAGNIAEPVSDNIFLDILPPRNLIIIINDGAVESNSEEVTLKLSAIDDISELNQMALSSDGINWSDWESYKSMVGYSLRPGDGTKTVYFKVNDNAGNIADPVSASIVLNTGSSGPGNGKNGGSDVNEGIEGMYDYIIISLIIVIIVIVVIVVIIARKKKQVKTDIEYIPAQKIHEPGSTGVVKPGAVPAPTITLEQVEQRPPGSLPGERQTNGNLTQPGLTEPPETEK